MAYIKHHTCRRDSMSGKYEDIETDLPFEIKVLKLADEGGAQVFLHGKCIAKVHRDGIEIYNAEVVAVNESILKFDWVVSCPSGCKYIISVTRKPFIGGTLRFNNGNIQVGEITTRGGVIDAVSSWMKMGSFNYISPSMGIEFDDNLIEPIFALCLLLRESCRPITSSS